MDAPGTTIATVFADMVDSTATMAALAPHEADDVRHHLFGLLRGALAETGGTEVKTLGDGIMATFGAVGAAVAGAVRMQQRFERHNARHTPGIHIRVGVSVGDAVLEDGDWYGLAVVEAARLCAAAGPDQILATDAVRLLSGRAATFEPVGRLELKGLPDPIDAHAIRWDPLEAEDLALPLPPRLETARVRRFVARVEERAHIDKALGDAREGRGRTILVAGEPGIGKTSLAAEAAVSARRRGITTLYGRSEEDLGLPYQPFVEALTHLVAHAPQGLLAAHVAEHGGELARLVPDLARRIRDAPPPRAADADSERHLLYGAIAGLLASAAGEDGLLLVLDDLHWADQATLQLLRYLVSAGRGGVAVLGTYRGTELPETHPLSDLVADLHREEGTLRLDLEGLANADVAELVEAYVGPRGTRLADAVHRETAGNPFFVREVLRSVREQDELPEEWSARPDTNGGRLPTSVREVILRRVRRLGERAAEVLATAATIGREFDADLLRRALRDDDLEPVLDAAVEAALLREVPGHAGRLTFPHALVEYTLYDHLRPAHRWRTHERVGIALEELCGDDPGARVGELAHHWAQAAAGGDVTKALHYARLAGDRALAQLAPEEGLRWYARALELLDRRGAEENGERRELMLLLATAQRNAADPAFRETFLEVARLARRDGDAERLVQAALGNNRGGFSGIGEIDEARIEVLEEALEVERRRTPQRALLLAHLADELVFVRSATGRRRELTDEALDIAQDLGDPATLAEVMHRRSLHWAPDIPVEQRLAEADATVQSTRRAGAEARFLALRSRCHARLCAVDADGAREDLRAQNELLEEVPLPTLRWVTGVLECELEAIAGNLDVADRIAAEGLEVAMRNNEPDAAAIFASSVVQVRYEQGRLGELQPLVAQTAATNANVPAWQAAHALACAAAGLHDEARHLLSRGTEPGFLPRDIVYETGLAMFALAACIVQDVAAARPLRELLADGGTAVISNGTNAWMTTQHHRGALASLLGRFDEAERELAEAAALHERLRAPIWLARTRFEQLRLRDRRGGEHRRGLAEAADELEAEARRLGAADVERDAVRLRDNARTLRSVQV